MSILSIKSDTVLTCLRRRICITSAYNNSLMSNVRPFWRALASWVKCLSFVLLMLCRFFSNRFIFCDAYGRHCRPVLCHVGIYAVVTTKECENTEYSIKDGHELQCTCAHRNLLVSEFLWKSIDLFDYQILIEKHAVFFIDAYTFRCISRRNIGRSNIRHHRDVRFASLLSECIRRVAEYEIRILFRILIPIDSTEKIR